jgi:hypothetical protein
VRVFLDEDGGRPKTPAPLLYIEPDSPAVALVVIDHLGVTRAQYRMPPPGAVELQHPLEIRADLAERLGKVERLSKTARALVDAVLDGALGSLEEDR